MDTSHMSLDDKIKAYLDLHDVEDSLQHYGTPRHSGRYPWGSGENPYQRNEDFHRVYNDLKAQGMTDAEMAREFDCSINELKARRSMSSQQEKERQRIRVVRLHDNKGMGWTAIAKEMGLKNESTARSIYKNAKEPKKQLNQQVADRLEKILKEKGGFLDISTGTELGYPWSDNAPKTGISSSQLRTASIMLREKGYSVQTINLRQVTNPGQYTNTTVLAPAGTSKKDIINNLEQLHSVEDYTPDAGRTWWVPEWPEAIDRSRVYVKYPDEGGAERDGMVEIRPGVKDLSLGDMAYAQVRIAVKNCDVEGKVDDYGKPEPTTRYIKGMAVYSDEIPEGYDIVVNSSKARSKGDAKAFKPIKDTTDVDAVFGAKIMANGQDHYIGDDGKEHLGLINKVNGEGTWQGWSKTLPSQMLSKQPKELIKRQLNLTYAEALDEFNEIKNYTNDVVRQKALEEFASQCDSAAVDLKAAALPRQQSHVLIPINTLKDNEVYAPGYKNGEEVVLIRYPHEGTFQIPRLIVNNKNKEGTKFIGKMAPDAIGINHNVAEIMSGADFDGDTVTVIPTSKIVNIKNRPPLEGLVGFDAKAEYPYREGMKHLDKKRTQTEMGVISNLITDMTMIGAKDEELVRVVKYANTVIDADKHNLDWQRSYKENDIESLKKKYQVKYDKDGNVIGYGGAGTLLSRAGSEAHILEQQLAKIDENTGELKKAWRPDASGELMYMPTGRTRMVPEKNKDGSFKLDAEGKKIYKEEPVRQKVSKMSQVDDARQLMSNPQKGYIQEELYAEYANNMKHLAIQARKEAMAIKPEKCNPEAREAYKAEVDSLNAKLENAKRNAPKERQAQVIANVVMKELKEANPGMDNEKVKKEAQLQIAKARASVGANKKDVQVNIEPREWEAIQKNAISPSKLREILKNADSDKIKKLASPQVNSNALPKTKQNLIKSMATSGFTLEEIAERLGVSKATVFKYAKGKEG
ncbi:MAG: TetR family transcriptional regulator [Methanobrevibacter sp.]|nr:TetR family transcriptional regulator [Methanobrevibacter sp.]